MRGRIRIWFFVVGASLFPFSVHAGPFSEEGKHGQNEETMKVPETAGQIWHEIDEKLELLDATITNRQLAKVHSIAFAIRDLAKVLPDKSKDLSEAKQKLLIGYVKRIADHAKNLDTYGDAGNQSKTEEEFNQLKKRIEYMRKLYPESVFRTTEHQHGQTN